MIEKFKAHSLSGILFTLLSFIFSPSLLGQPGGGGGLQILNLKANGKNIPASAFNTLSILQVHISHFPDGEVDMAASGFSGYLTNDVYSPRESCRTYYSCPANWRIRWKVDADSMIVDFEDLFPENGAGYTPMLDTLVFKPGYYRMHCDSMRLEALPMPSHPFQYGFYYYYSIAQQLLAKGNLVEAKRFLDLANAKITDAHQLNKLEYQNAFYQEKLENYTEALATLKRIELSEPSAYLDKDIIDVLKHLNRYGDCLPYYEDYYRLAENKNSVSYEYAQFLSTYLGRHQDALNVLEKLRLEIPANCMHDRPIGTCDYNDLLFVLGKVHLSAGNTQEAFRYFLLATQFNLQGSSTDEYINYFESLRTTYPDAPELLVCIAFCKLFMAPYQGWGNLTNASLYEANQLCEDALARGYKEFITYYCQAYVNYVSKDYAKGLKAVEQAMKRDTSDARPYLLKAMILSSSGKPEEFKYWQNEYFKHEPNWKITW